MTANNKFKLFDNVMLREDLPDYPLKKGAIGTIVEFLKPGVYEVDFSGNQGQTYAMYSVHDHQLIAVPDSVIEFLETIENSNVQIGIEELTKISSACLNDRFDDVMKATSETIEIINQETSDKLNGSDTFSLKIKVPRKVLNWLIEVAKFHESSSIV